MAAYIERRDLGVQVDNKGRRCYEVHLTLRGPEGERLAESLASKLEHFGKVTEEDEQPFIEAMEHYQRLKGVM